MARMPLLALAAVLFALALGAAPAGAATRSVDALSAARLTFTGPGSGVGASVAQLGDVNGDGRPDVAIGAPFTDLPGRSDAGVVYVVFGSTATGTQSLEALGTGGFEIVGGKFYRAGFEVRAAGDVNRDGRPDILLAAPRKGVAGNKTPGSAYVVYGKADSTTVDLPTLRSSQGFEIVGTAPSAGSTLAGVGDLDRDGYADLAVTEGYYRKKGFDYRGGAAVIYGSKRPGRVDLQHLGSRGFRVAGAELNGGTTVGAAGDVNGDHRADLLLGANHLLLPGKRFPVNAVFVVFGRRSTATLDLRRLGSRGFRIGGLVAQQIYSPPATGVGDLNGDHRADVLLIRLPGGSVGRRPEATIVFGSRSTKTVDAGRLGARGFRILGESATGRFSGLSTVAALGDVNGDGVPDLGLGSWTRPPSDSYAYDYSAFVIYGRRATTTVRLEDLGATGVRLTGPVSTMACGAPGLGSAIAPAGDFDGDGHPDLLLGAWGLDSCAGRALVVPAP